MVVVGRTGYRIDCRTIKGGSQVSSLIVSFVESSNHCILASSFLVLVWCFSLWVLELMVILSSSWQARVHRKRSSHMHLLWCFRWWSFCRFFIHRGFTYLYLRHTPSTTSEAYLCRCWILFVVIYPTSLSLLNSELICRSYGSSGFIFLKTS